VQNKFNPDDLDQTFVAYSLYRTSVGLAKQAFIQLSYAFAGLQKATSINPDLGMCYTQLVKGLHEAIMALEPKTEQDVAEQVLDLKALEYWLENNKNGILKGQEQLENNEEYKQFMGEEPQTQVSGFDEAAKLWGIDESKFKKS
jgi:hypothetical protein